MVQAAQVEVSSGANARNAAGKKRNFNEVAFMDEIRLATDDEGREVLNYSYTHAGTPG
jgi:hypothetical protein